MKKLLLLSTIFLITSCSNNENNLLINTTLNSDITINSDLSSKNVTQKNIKQISDSELRKMYSKPTSQWVKASLDKDVEYKELGLLPSPIHPASNPFSADKAELGKALFFDNRLAKYGMFSCATCHNPDNSWADGLDRHEGNDKIPLKRNSPSIANTAYFNSMFWDNRAKDLETQAHEVLLNPREMNSNEKLIQRSIGDDENYIDLFKKSFGSSDITLPKVSMALATFQRTINTKNNSPFDTFIKGNYNSLNDSQIRGLHLFRTKARCMNCHQGSNFSDNKMHNTGLVMPGTEFEDLGRFDITKQDKDYGVFRTASLRNISKTAPYFHNGQTKTIKEIINMYNQGMPQVKNKSKLIKALGLNETEINDLENFLNSLSEELPKVRKPDFRK